MPFKVSFGGASMGDTPYHYLYDGHGDVRGLTDTTGNVTGTYDYGALGNGNEPDGRVR